VTDPPWNRLDKKHSRLHLRRGGTAAQPLDDGGLPVPPARACDTDHLADSDIQKHCDLWYKILADTGVVLLRLDWGSWWKWVTALKTAQFHLMPGPPHGFMENPCLAQVPDTHTHHITLCMLCSVGRHRIDIPVSVRVKNPRMVHGQVL
jgi:hypothetical protein